ncbi:U3 small nucleolar RNA-associated protein 6-domain-containing protein [Gautieria morchelliformis]|nr:U3 small nucleolar RNA-associated protein 6-domain-containing protein [Gautieria morchelliformis]
MERVEFQQEQMLTELKDLEQKGLFSKSEIKSIMKRRTAFESALVRRIPKKGDFLRYAAYEMGLEALRRRRLKRLNLPVAAPSISDFALVRRQFHIFERALRKFKADVALWVQYIELAKREGARALVGRISARALQLHPNEPALYVFAAQHEVDNLSPPAARALLQRGIRLNKENVPLWTEYVKFELGFVEGLRRRWDVLGVGGASIVTDTREDVSEEARREIMQGGIVMAVISEAAKANPHLHLFRSLHALVNTYPTPLRASLLGHLHGLLAETLPSDPAALKMHATRFLPASGEPEASEEFVDRLKAANEELLGRARTLGGAVPCAYAEFVEEWCQQRELDPNLRKYLVGCLRSLTAEADVDARVLAAHVRLLSADAGDLEKAVRQGRKYTQGCRDGAVWLARLDAERLAGVGEAAVAQAWAEARRAVAGEGRGRVWMWGLGEGDNAKETCEGLLRDSIGEGELHVTLAIHYATRILHRVGAAPTATTRVGNLRRVVSTYLVTGAFFRAVFAHEARLEDAEKVLEMLYEAWRQREGLAVEASLAWADWLRGHGQSGRAAEIIGQTRGAADAWWRMLETAK